MSCESALNNKRKSEDKYVQNGANVIRGFDFSEFVEIAEYGGTIIENSVSFEEVPEEVITVGGHTVNVASSIVSVFIQCPESGSGETKTNLICQVQVAFPDSEEIATLRLCGTVVCCDC